MQQEGYLVNLFITEHFSISASLKMRISSVRFKDIDKVNIDNQDISYPMHLTCIGVSLDEVLKSPYSF